MQQVFNFYIERFYNENINIDKFGNIPTKPVHRRFL